MNLWINHRLEELKKTLAKVEVLLINDSEARELAGDWNVIRAARAIRAMGPKTLIIKKGEHGALLFQEDSCFLASAFPLEHVKDPTGAGDSFAGGLMGYLDQSDSHDEATFRQAVIMGSTVASFCCEDFGVERLLTLKQRVLMIHRLALFHYQRRTPGTILTDGRGVRGRNSILTFLRLQSGARLLEVTGQMFARLRVFDQVLGCAPRPRSACWISSAQRRSHASTGRR